MPSPLIAIVGPTASGKSALAMELARRFNGEIIAADSRTIYKGMDIGTAKPPLSDQREIKHHLLDVVEPDQSYSAAEFQQAANVAIDEIAHRGKLPILVGGTGLYVDAVLYNYNFDAGSDPKLRQELSELSVEQLQERVESMGVELNQSDSKNPRRLIRALETEGLSRQKSPLREGALVLGVQVEREFLKKRIAERIDQMLEQGFEREVKDLLNKYGTDAPGLDGIGYRAFIDYLEGSITRDEAVARFIKGDLNLAKRQMTWFKRNPDINWIATPEQAIELVSSFLKRL